MAIEPQHLIPYRFNGQILDYSDEWGRISAKVISSGNQHSVVEIYAQWFADEHGEGGEHTQPVDPDRIESWQWAVSAFRVMREGIDWQRLVEGCRAVFAPDLPSLTHADEVERLRAEIEALKEQLSACEVVAMTAVHKEAYAAKLEEQAREASNKLQGIRAVIGCSTMDPADRIIGLATLLHVEARENIKKHTDPELGVRVNRGDVARLAAMSEDRVTKAWKSFIEADAWERSDTSWWNEAAGHTETNAWLRMDGSPVDRLFALATLNLPRNQGGKRTPRDKVFCENCGKTHIERKAYTECQDCGATWDKQSYDVNERIERERLLATYTPADGPVERETLIAAHTNLNSLETLLAAHTPADGPASPAAEISERQVRLPLVQRAVPAGEGVEDIVLPPEPLAKRPKRHVRQVTGSISHRLQGYAAGGAD